MQFSSVEEIDRHYADAINRPGTSAAAIVELKIEKAQVVADFRLQSIAEREKAVWMRDALHDFPLAGEFKELVQGDTEQAIRKSAQTLNERLAKLAESHMKQKRANELVAAQLAAEQSQESPDGAVQQS